MLSDTFIGDGVYSIRNVGSTDERTAHFSNGADWITVTVPELTFHLNGKKIAVECPYIQGTGPGKQIARAFARGGTRF